MSNKNLLLAFILIAILGVTTVFVGRIFYETSEEVSGLSAAEEETLLKVFPYGETLDLSIVKNFQKSTPFIFPTVNKSQIGVDYRTMFKQE